MDAQTESDSGLSAGSGIPHESRSGSSSANTEPARVIHWLGGKQQICAPKQTRAAVHVRHGGQWRLHAAVLWFPARLRHSFDRQHEYSMRSSFFSRFLIVIYFFESKMETIIWKRLVFGYFKEVMTVKREFKCCAGSCWFADCCDDCAYEVTIESPPGCPIGYIKQRGSFWTAHYDILDEKRQRILTIEGPCCVLDGDFHSWQQEFNILN